MKLYTPDFKKLNKITPKKITVSIYGLGKMGLPLACVFADSGFNVIGTDINKQLINSINKLRNPIEGEKGLDILLKKVVKSKKLTATLDGAMASKNSDIKIIIVPTLIDQKNNPNLKPIEDVVSKIAKGLQKGDIVILESTAPAGTTLNVIGKKLEKLTGLVLNKDFSVAHCPERTSSGTAIENIRGNPSPKIISGSDKLTLEIMKLIYERINLKGVVVVENLTVAELVKVWEGVYRDVNIAFANNLYLACRDMGVNAFDVIEACNTDKFCNILKPGPGVGGHCIPVYPYFILKKTKVGNKLLNLSRQINDGMTDHVIKLIEEVLEEKGRRLRNSDILVLGIAYRSGVKEIRKSPAINVLKKLKSLAKNVYTHDPNFSPDEIEVLGFKYKKGFSGIDCVLVMTRESEFKKINWTKAKDLRTKSLVDTQKIIDEKKLQLLDFSFRRLGYAK